MVLSHLLKSCGLEHTLLHCNFKLRGAESDRDEEFVRDYAKLNKLDLHVQTFETAEASEQLGMNIQETARKLRYDWFKTFLADNHSYLLTAHHLDDSIETFFINLLRGTSIKGLRGIPSIHEQVVRPLSSFTVDKIYNYIDTHGISYRKDSSNDSQRYRRNKLRQSILPEFKEMEPQFQQKMGNLMNDAEVITDFLKKEAYEIQRTKFETTQGRTVFATSLLEEIHPALLPYLFADFQLQRKHISELMKLKDSAIGSKFRQGSFIFVKDRDRIIVSQELVHEFFEILVSKLPTKISSPMGNLQLERKSFSRIIPEESVQQFELERIVLPLCIRKWEEGDKIRPLGMGGSKLISDILIDKKVDILSKDRQLVLADGSGNILALIGKVISEDYKVTEATKEVIELRIT